MREVYVRGTKEFRMVSQWVANNDMLVLVKRTNALVVYRFGSTRVDVVYNGSQVAFIFITKEFYR